MRHVLVSVVLFGAVSCSDSSAPDTRGSVAFTYTGAGGGSFSASGDAPALTAHTPTDVSWAVGYVETGETYVGGARPRSGGLVDMAVLRFEHATPGSEGIDPTCNIDGSVACTGMVLFLNFNGNGDTGDFFCGLTSGTIVLTEVTGSRARGTFSGNGDCITASGGASSAFAVSNGTFDVALVAPPA